MDCHTLDHPALTPSIPDTQNSLPKWFQAHSRAFVGVFPGSALLRVNHSDVCLGLRHSSLGHWMKFHSGGWLEKKGMWAWSLHLFFSPRPCSS